MADSVKKISSKTVSGRLLKRKPDANKGDFGHVMVIAGSKGMLGAAVLCSVGALRSGAGLVTAVVPESLRKTFYGISRPEIMTLGLPDKDGYFLSEGAGIALSRIKEKKISAVVIGPGLGRTEEITRFVEELLSSLSVPVIIDADGLNSISMEFLKKNKGKDILLTPHPGEFSKITGISIGMVMEKRAYLAKKYAQELDCVIVLKGNNTIVTDGKDIFMNSTGNPGMATGGSGDVLSGMIAAMVSQVRGNTLFNSALCAVYMHGAAGDIAAEKKTEIAMIAGDIVENISSAFNKILK